MSRLVAAFGRLVVILGGFLFASLGASAFLHLLFLGGMPLSDERGADVAGSLIFSVPFAALFIGYFALVPAMALILLAEVLARRDWLYFALTGGLAGLAAIFLLGLHGRGDGPLDPALLALVCVAAGAVGGLCYWLVAGRSSGVLVARQSRDARG